MEESRPPNSPKWGTMTKLVVTLTLVVILGALLVRFKFIIGPVLMAFILSYLLFPVAALMSKKTPLSWGVAVNLIYLVLIIILLALLAWGGMGIISQLQNLINAVNDYAGQLPTLINNLSHNSFTLGPFRFDSSTFDWQAIGNQILSYIQPTLGKMGDLVGTLASSAASTLTWIAFIIIVSYFILLESRGFRTRIIQVNIPGYSDDIHHLSSKLGRIWNAFLRGQVFIFFSKVISYTILMSILGVHYAIPVALVAGLAGFLPYIGMAVNWIVIILVTYFQGYYPFGLSPLGYTAVAILIALIIDQVHDNLISPRIMASSLKVHPAFVLIAAIIAANLIGILGLIIAAPLLATLQLIGRYTVRKLLDNDPWPKEEEKNLPMPGAKWFQKIHAWWRKQLRKASDKSKGIQPIPEEARKNK
jgi:predicted PurR-regulated permease PerM